MTLREKYQSIVDVATQAGANLTVAEQNGVLYIQGDVPSGEVKDKLWEVYGTIDPTFSGGDLVLDVNAAVAEGGKVRVITKDSNLNIRQGPGTDQPIVGKAAKDEIITLISKSNDQWWLVRTNDGEQGYSYAAYLEPVV